MPLSRFAPLLALTLAACAFIAPVQPPSTFYVMRHLETSPGPPDPDLTARGRQQAEALAGWFGNATPAAIFVTNTRRARQTAAPLAARLGIEPRFYDPADTPGLIAELQKEPPPVLIVGHSNTVPLIVQALGGGRLAPVPHDRFGDIWVISGARRSVEQRALDIMR